MTNTNKKINDDNNNNKNRNAHLQYILVQCTEFTGVGWRGVLTLSSSKSCKLH